MSQNLRKLCIDVLKKVLYQGKSLDEALSNASEKAQTKNISLIKFLCFGVIREHESLNFILNQLLEKPLKSKDPSLQLILLLGLFQLKSSRIPEHAAINETVELCKACHLDFATGLTNAILRRFLREKESILAKLATAQISDHPQWLLTKIQIAYPQQWPEIIKANNAQGPMHLRVNQRKISTEAYLNLLTEQNIKAKLVPACPEALTLEQAVDINELPQFEQGFVSVQDLSAQLAAHLLELQPGLKVLDACAAPGGKSCHMLELCDIDLTCMDISKTRLQLVQHSLDRLGLSAKLLEEDASTAFPEQEALFDRILIDAPCSGTGVIRRHPDIKFLRKASDIEKLHQVQINIIKNLTRLLKPKGILVYATCSILPEENDQIIAETLKIIPQLKVEKIDFNHANLSGQASSQGWQFLPSINNNDGFFYAKLNLL